MNLGPIQFVLPRAAQQGCGWTDGAAFGTEAVAGRLVFSGVSNEDRDGIMPDYEATAGDAAERSGKISHWISDAQSIASSELSLAPNDSAAGLLPGSGLGQIGSADSSSAGAGVTCGVNGTTREGAEAALASALLADGGRLDPTAPVVVEGNLQQQDPSASGRVVFRLPQSVEVDSPAVSDERHDSGISQAARHSGWFAKSVVESNVSPRIEPAVSTTPSVFPSLKPGDAKSQLLANSSGAGVGASPDRQSFPSEQPNLASDSHAERELTGDWLSTPRAGQTDGRSTRNEFRFAASSADEPRQVSAGPLEAAAGGQGVPTPWGGGEVGRNAGVGQRESKTPEASTTSTALTEPKSPEQTGVRTALRELTLRVDSGSGRRVDLQFVENGGAVSLKLRTQDVQVADSLRVGLPQLESDLSSRGWKAELNPASGQASKHVAADSADRSEQQGTLSTRGAGATDGPGQHRMGSGADSGSRQQQRTWSSDEQELLEMAALRRLAAKGEER